MQRFWYRPGYLFGARNTLFDMYFFSSTLVYKPGGGSFGDSSDLRLKKDVVSLTGALDQLLSLRGVSFQWIDPEKHGGLTGPQMGFIAQEVEGVFPQWVTTAPDGYKSVGLPMGFSALTVEAIRDLATEVQVQRADSQAQNETLKAKNAALEADLVGTKAELAATKATLADLLQRVQALEAKK
jgi:hypothetical protein